MGAKLWTNEQLKEAVKNSNNIAECIRELDLNSSSTTYKCLRRAIEENNIDFSHFNPSKYVKPRNLDEILVENSTYTSSNCLKKRLFKNNIFENKCSLCGLSDEWNNKKIIHILDHINGVNNDNRIENLRIVCPNCNSQLDTFAGRNCRKYIEFKNPENKVNVNLSNNKIQRTCTKCSKKVNYRCKGNLCLECLNKNKRIKVRPSYENLIEDIELNGLRNTGKKYNVSHSTIRQWIKVYEKEINFISEDLKL